MRFKNGLKYRVTPFKEYEIELPRDEVMYKLKQQAQICRDEDSNGVELQFTYYNDGDFILNDSAHVTVDSPSCRAKYWTKTVKRQSRL